MTNGHREAQEKFLALGHALGFGVSRTWTQRNPTDGVWYVDVGGLRDNRMPLVAAEVVVSEGKKSLRGSISTLEQVSPALAVIIVQDDEIRRRLIRQGVCTEAAKKQCDHVRHIAESECLIGRQRFEIWSYGELHRRHAVMTKSTKID